MFRHYCVILRELAFITLPNYIGTIAALDKINKIFKTLKLSNMIARLLLHEVCMVLQLYLM